MFFLTKAIKKIKLKKALLKISIELKDFIKNIEIPIIIVSYNNHSHVKNMVLQLNKFNIRPIIIDNNSTNKETTQYLMSLNSEKAFVIFSDINIGYKVGFMSPVYDVLPDIFGYTDPDLKFKENLPKDFINEFKMLSEKYNVYKVGCAIELSGDINKDIVMEIKSTDKPFFLPLRKYSILEWESRYWKLKIDDENFEIYSAPIDTTFAIYNKKYYFFNLHEAIRVAGNYSVFHLPWYKEMDLMDEKELKEYHENNNSNTWKIDGK